MGGQIYTMGPKALQKAEFEAIRKSDEAAGWGRAMEIPYVDRDWLLDQRHRGRISDRQVKMALQSRAYYKWLKDNKIKSTTEADKIKSYRKYTPLPTL